MSVNPFPTPYPATTAQLAYASNFSQDVPGTPADDSKIKDFITGIAPAAYIMFGCLVVNDPSVSAGGGQVTSGSDTYTSPAIGGGIGQGCKHPASSADVTGGVLGIAVRTGAMESRRDTYPPSYRPGDPVNIMRTGRVWTASEVAVTMHDPVYVRVATSASNTALNQIGALSNAADGTSTVLVPGAKWFDTQAAPGSPARVELSLGAQ